MMKESIQLKKDDKVKVIAGKDKGKVGKVLKVIQKKNRVLVENINVVKRHTKPNAQNRQGGATNASNLSGSKTKSWTMAKRSASAGNATKS